MKKMIIAGCLLLGLTTACSNEGGNNIDNPRRDIPLSRSEAELKDAQMDFSFRLINTMGAKNETENWVISPFTSFVNLSILANGANDEIRDEFVSVLGFPKDATIEDVNNYNKKMLGELPALDRKTSFSLASSNWISDECKLVDGFAEVTNEYYDAPVTSVSFKDIRTNPSNPFNQWVSDRIGMPFILDETLTDIYSITASVLNFKSEWSVKFDKRDTDYRSFHNYSGRTVQVLTMKGIKGSHYYSDEADALRLPFGNGSYSMYIFLPENDINEFVSGFTAEKFRNLTYDEMTRSVHLELPKFEIKYNANLTSNLEKMGLVKTISGEGNGKFSRFYEPVFSKYKDTILHSSLVNFGIDEDGGEVKVAVTTQSGLATAPGPVEHLDFIVDRPFFYMVIENSTNSVIAAGTVYDF